MPTESIMLVVGARDEYSTTFKKASKDVDTLEKGIGDTADTSARTTAALALMLQTMEDSPIKGVITDLGILKGTLDSVRAAEADNASSIEKLVAQFSFVLAAVSTVRNLNEAWRAGTDRVREYNRQLEETSLINSILSEQRQRERSLGQFELSLIDDPEKQKAKLNELVAAEEEAIGTLIVQRRNLQSTLAEIRTEQTRNAGVDFEDPERLELLNTRLAETNNTIRERRNVIRDLRDEANKISVLEWKKLNDAMVAQVQSNEQVVAGLERQVLSLKMTKDELVLYELSQKGVTLAQKERAIAAIEEARALEETRRANDESRQAMEQQAATDRSYLDGLKAMVIELRHGRDAAREFREAQAGISEAARAEGDIYRQQIEAMETRNRLNQEAKRIVESNRTPLERFRTEYEKLAEVFSAGLLDENQFTRQLEKLKAQVRGSAGGGGGRSPGFGVQSDSSRFLTRGRGGNTQELIANKTKEQVDLTKKMITIFEEINQKVGTPQPGGGRLPVHKGGR